MFTLRYKIRTEGEARSMGDPDVRSIVGEEGDVPLEASAGVTRDGDRDGKAAASVATGDLLNVTGLGVTRGRDVLVTGGPSIGGPSECDAGRIGAVGVGDAMC